MLLALYGWYQPHLKEVMLSKGLDLAGAIGESIWCWRGSRLTHLMQLGLWW